MYAENVIVMAPMQPSSASVRSHIPNVHLLGFEIVLKAGEINDSRSAEEVSMI